MQVLDYFRQIAEIPHGSGNEKGISDFMVGFAKEHGLEVIQDETLNIIIKKPATPGYENAPVIILQGHLDMVCEKNSDVEHDFLKDPLKLIVDGDILSAEGTTLGGDDGVAVAMAMAILADDNLSHPALEVLLTTGEETSMIGAEALDPSLLKGRTLINLDSEEEGEFCTSCAGGFRVKAGLKLEYAKAEAGDRSYLVHISGLNGGHSGCDIQLGRGNANKMMGTLLRALPGDKNLFKLAGGLKDNAIPRECLAGISTAVSLDELKKVVGEWQKAWLDKFGAIDDKLKIEIKETSKVEDVWTKEVTQKAIGALVLLPQGVQSMSPYIEGLVQSSTNLGVVEEKDGMLYYTNLVRSSVERLKEEIFFNIAITAENYDMEVVRGGDYPAWEYDADSSIRSLAIDVYKNMFGKEPKVKATHAGLECGLFARKFPGIDTISFGPQLYDVHTPDERLEISSLDRTYKFLIELLKNCK